jgi:hypothetical protein
MITTSQTRSVKSRHLVDSALMHALGEPRARPITVISEMNRTESIQPVQNEIGIRSAQAMVIQPLVALRT